MRQARVAVLPRDEAVPAGPVAAPRKYFVRQGGFVRTGVPAPV